jgi:hypothetical protein
MALAFGVPALVACKRRSGDQSGSSQSDEMAAVGQPATSARTVAHQRLRFVGEVAPSVGSGEGDVTPNITDLMSLAMCSFDNGRLLLNYEMNRELYFPTRRLCPLATGTSRAHPPRPAGGSAVGWAGGPPMDNGHSLLPLGNNGDP